MQTIRIPILLGYRFIKAFFAHIHFGLPEVAGTLANPISYGVPPQPRVQEERV